MESVSVATLTQEVRVALDRNNASGTLFSGNIDTLTLDEMIKDRLIDAARIVEMSVPLHMLVGAPIKNYDASFITWSTDATKPISGTMQAENDFLRLVRFRMSDWDYALTGADLITEDSPAYSRLKSRYPGITGNKQRPALALIMDNVGDDPTNMVANYFFEIYGSTHATGESTPSARYAYVPVPKITNNALAICPLCRQAIVAYAGNLVAGTLGETALASSLLGEARSLMQTDN